jgi:ABC-type amino acid transport substrate-binding protein
MEALMREKRRSLLVVALLALVCALALAACGDDDDDDGATQTNGATQAQQFDTIEAGVLTVGSDIPYEPFEFGREPDYEGFDIDMVNAIAERLGLEVKIVKTPFDTIFRNLAQGRFDMVASATTITEERKRTVDFSDPYFNADQSVVVPADSDIQSVADLEGEVIGAQLGTTGAEYAQNEIDAADVRTYDVVDDAFQALQAGQIVAAIIDFPVAKRAEVETGDVKVVETIQTDEQYGFAFAKESTALRDAVNRALAEIKQDGTYEEIFRKWFEADPPAEILQSGSGG